MNWGDWKALRGLQHVLANGQKRYLNSVWVSAHSRMIFLVLLILFFGGRCAFQVWSIYDSIPDLPKGTLQMVGLSNDGARFVVLNDDHDYAKGVNRISVLVVFDEPKHVEQGTFRFEAKRELVDCSKRQIAFLGAGFYDDQGHQTISRVSDDISDPKTHPFEAIETETTLVCDHEDFTQSRVVGYLAALAQTQAMVSAARSNLLR